MTEGVQPITLGDDNESIHAWVQQMRAEGLAVRTVTEWPRVVLRAARWSAADPAELTAEQVIDYLAALPSAGTRQTYFTALHAWHRWLIGTGRRADNPLDGLRRPRAPRREAHPVATDHLTVLLQSGIRRRTRTAVLLCAYQGLRVHEAVKIRGEDVDLIGSRFRVAGKGGVDVWRPLHPLVAAEAKRYPRRGYWFPSPIHPNRPIRRESLSAVISRAMDRCGVPGTAHSLRHWLGTELLRSGANARTVQEVLRHASLATVQIYTLVDFDQQRAALLSLPTPH
jgi:integrase/recombinase XerD